MLTSWNDILVDMQMIDHVPRGKAETQKGRVQGRLIPLVLATTLFAAACTPTVSQHGHRILDEDLAQIQPGVSTRRDVLDLLGSPSAQATFENDRWYYVTQRTERSSFYQKELTQQDVITVSFAADGTVDTIGNHGLEQANAVEPVDDTTRTLGNELSLVQQLLGNIGRFNSGDADAQ